MLTTEEGDTSLDRWIRLVQLPFAMATSAFIMIQVIFGLLGPFIAFIVLYEMLYEQVAFSPQVKLQHLDLDSETFSITENSLCGTGDLAHDTSNACVQCFNIASRSSTSNPSDLYEVTIGMGAHNRDNFDLLRITDAAGDPLSSDLNKANDVDEENDIALWYFVLDAPLQISPAQEDFVFCLRGDTRPLEPENGGDTVQVVIYQIPTIGSNTGVVAIDTVTEELVDADLGAGDVLICAQRAMTFVML